MSTTTTAPMTCDPAVLFTPLHVGSLRLPNRIVKSPQTTGLANQDGTVTQRLVNHYKRLAEGGSGLVLVEYTYIDDDASKSIQAQLGVSRREHVPGLGWLVDEVHAAGAKVGLQLEHCGRQKFLGTEPMKSASSSSWSEVEQINGVRPTPMTIDEIRGVVTAFGQAARRAYDAGFDLVEVHGGHGYLITNFLSPFTNDRTDDYGGSFENRRRLLLEVVDSIRAHVPSDFPLSIRLSVTDYEERGITIDETVELCRLLEARGVDVIHASGGHHALMEYEVSPWFMPRAIHRWGWEAIKEAVSVPVIASGSIVSPLVAAEIVGSGSADLVSLGRAMLADPDWANKTRRGQLLEIRPCIRCNDGCLHRAGNVGRNIGCTVNPHVGHEYAFKVLPAEERRSIGVVGAGPAGLRAAATLHDRGHDVTVYTRRTPGGGLAVAAEVFADVELTELLAHLRHEVERREITVRIGEATPNDLATAGHSIIVNATGLRPIDLGDQVIDRDDRTIVADDLTRDRLHQLTGPVVVVGGGIIGVRLASTLAASGVEVTLLEQRDRLLDQNDVFTDQMALPGIVERSGADIRLGYRLTAVGPSTVTASGPDDTQHEIPAASVVLAIGHEPDVQDWVAVDGAEIVTIGGAQRRGRLFDALHDGFFTARRL